MSMIDMASIAYGKRHEEPQDKQKRKKARKQPGQQENKKEDKQAKRQTKGDVHKGQMQVWIGCPQLHYVEAWMTHQQPRLMHGHVNKRVKMHKRSTGSANKHGKHIIAQSGKREGYARRNPTFGDASQMVTPNQSLMGVGCNHTTTNLLKASNVAQPRSRVANMEDKAQKQANIYMQIRMIQTL